MKYFKLHVPGCCAQSPLLSGDQGQFDAGIGGLTQTVPVVGGRVQTDVVWYGVVLVVIVLVVVEVLVVVVVLVVEVVVVSMVVEVVVLVVLVVLGVVMTVVVSILAVVVVVATCVSYPSTLPSSEMIGFSCCPTSP